MKRTIGEVRKSSSVHCSQRSRSTVSAGVSRCRGVGVVIVLPTMQSAGCLVCAKRGERMVSEQEGATTSTHKTKVTVNFSRKFTTIVRAGPRQKQNCDRFRVSELTPSDDIQGSEMPNTQDMAREYAPQSKCSINVGHLLPSSPPVPFLIFTHHCRRLPHHTLACRSISARTL